MENKKRILFVHNTAADYRIPFFKMVSQILEVKFLFTKMYLNEEVYGNKGGKEKLREINYEIVRNKFNIAIGLIDLMGKEEFDIVIMPTMDSMCECIDAIIVFIIAKVRKKKIIYFWENWDAPRDYLTFTRKIKNLVKRIIVKPILHKVDLCLASGQKAYEHFQALGVNSDKILLGIDASEVDKSKSFIDVREFYKIIKKKKIILYYGRIIKRKGLDYLIKSFYYLEKDFPDVHLLICGDGDFKEQCINISKKLGIDNITFVGKVKPEDREIYFSQCDIFVLPSYFYKGHIEAWGLTINESMQFGKPVITTNAVGAAYDMINNGINGYMVEQGSSQELYRALKNVISDNNLYNKMCDESKITIEDKYNYKNMTEIFCSAVDLVNK